jgi:hypothetical protein
MHGTLSCSGDDPRTPQRQGIFFATLNGESRALKVSANEWHLFVHLVLNRMGEYFKSDAVSELTVLPERTSQLRSCLFLWSSSQASRPSCGFETKAHSTASCPVVITKRQAAFHTAAK